MKTYILFLSSILSLAVRGQNPAPASLSLEEAKRIAYQKNPSRRVARERFNQAHERLRQIEAAYHPRIDLYAGALWTLSTSLFDQEKNPTLETNYTQYNLGVTASWKLFDGFKRRHDRAAALFNKEAVLYWELDSARMLSEAVTKAYFNILIGEKVLTEMKKHVEREAGILSILEARFAMGLIYQTELDDTKRKIESMLRALMSTDKDIYAARVALGSLMVLDEGYLPETTQLKVDIETQAQEILSNPLPHASSLTEKAFKDRPDLHYQSILVRAAQETSEAQESEKYPQVNATFNLGASRQDDPNFNSDDIGASIGIYVTWNIWDGGLNRSKVREARSKTREAEAMRENVRQNIREDILMKIRSLEDAKRELSNQELIIEAATSKVSNAQDSFAAGNGDLVSVKYAESNLEAERAKLDQLKALIVLQRSMLNLSLGDDFYFDSNTGRIRP